MLRVRMMCLLHTLGGLCPCRSKSYDVSGEEQKMGEDNEMGEDSK